jgi:hypothetical protein
MGEGMSPKTDLFYRDARILMRALDLSTGKSALLRNPNIGSPPTPAFLGLRFTKGIPSRLSDMKRIWARV